MSYLENLKKKWNLQSVKQVIIVLLVFALTGFTVLFLKKPIVALIAPGESENTWFTVGYYVLILPFYNVILLFYGFLFGQFNFFWEFEKRSFRRVFGIKD